MSGGGGGSIYRVPDLVKDGAIGWPALIEDHLPIGTFGRTTVMAIGQRASYFVLGGYMDVRFNVLNAGARVAFAQLHLQ